MVSLHFVINLERLSQYLKAMDEHNVKYTCELTGDWRDTGRTLLTVHVDTPEGYIELKHTKILTITAP